VKIPSFIIFASKQKGYSKYSLKQVKIKEKRALKVRKILKYPSCINDLFKIHENKAYFLKFIEKM
jgi:hypothetical protein